LSLGAIVGATFLAVEPRIKTAVLLSAGVPRGMSTPEIDLGAFAPRITMPLLMISGRNDFFYLLDTQQKPLFEYFGTPRAQKKWLILDGVGYVPPPRPDIIREVLEWLDAHLGPVDRR